MQLKKSPKIYDNYKCDHPESTIQKIEQGFKEIGLDVSYKDVSYKKKNSLIYNGRAYIDILGWNQNGKGTTPLLAKASAYAELAERFSTGYILIKIPLPQKTKKFQHLLQHINSKSFLEGYQKIENYSSFSRENLSKYFNKHLPLDDYNFFKKKGLLDYSVDAYSLIKEKTIQVPIPLIELLSMSNGLASGNTFEEAISQASFEIFERHAVNQVINNKTICPTIDKNTIDNPKIQQCIKFLNSLDIEVLIKDFSLSNKIPVICVLFINRKYENEENPLIKQKFYKRIDAGSHCNLYEAILRCFTEYMDCLVSEKKRHDVYEKIYDFWTETLGKEYQGGPDDETKYLTRQYDYYGDLSFLERGETKSFKQMKNSVNQDSFQDVKEIIQICDNNNWDISVIDYTHKILQFPTVRVIIPPLSTDFDKFKIKILRIKDFEERINSFYGIDNFFKYIKKDGWLENKQQIKKLISNLERYLSKELDHFDFFLSREDNFFQWINLLHILPFLYFAIDDYKTAKKYFKLNIKLNIENPVESTFYDYLHHTKYHPDIYKTYLKLIERYKNKDKHFDLKYNPFNMETCRPDQEQLYRLILEKIGDTFRQKNYKN